MGQRQGLTIGARWPILLSGISSYARLEVSTTRVGSIIYGQRHVSPEGPAQQTRGVPVSLPESARRGNLDELEYV